MAMYQNMLVVIDPNQDDQPALRRAVYLHQRIGGKIKAFLPIYDFSYEMTTLLSPDERTAMRQGVISQRTAWIHEQAKYYLNAGVPIEIKVVWHNRPFEAIIQEVISGGHDLVLKMAHQHDRLEAVIFTPTDWHLLRKCPSPVWMVKDQPWPEGGKALVAVNLAVMNLLPLPALDGGKIFFLVINAVSMQLFKKQIPAKYENYIHFAGLILLLALMAVITFSDVWKLIH